MTRPLHELLASDEGAWPQVASCVKDARIPVEVLPPDERERSEALLETQVSIRSPLGAVVYHTGGILIDSGWLRLLGSRHSRLPRSLPVWNRGRSITAEGRSLGFLLIADDVVGGFYALNGGAFGASTGEVFYFAPDTLRWEPMNNMGYSGFLLWALSPSLKCFYEGMYWNGWESEVSALAGDQAFSIYPPLWTSEGKSVAQCSRNPCPIAEIYSLNVIEFPKQLASRTE
jgi:hypothetical protein